MEEDNKKRDREKRGDDGEKVGRCMGKGEGGGELGGTGGGEKKRRECSV